MSTTRVRIAYLDDNKNLHFCVGYDCGYVDPFYEHADNNRANYRDCYKKLCYKRFDGKEIEVTVPYLLTGDYVNWMDGAEEEFNKKVKRLVEKYAEKEISLLKGRFIPLENNRFELRFENHTSLKGQIKTHWTNPCCCFDNAEEDEAFIRQQLNFKLAINSLIIKGVSIATTSLRNQWKEGLATITSDSIVDFFVKDDSIWMRVRGDNNMFDVVTLCRYDLDVYSEGIKTGMIETAYAL